MGHDPSTRFRTRDSIRRFVDGRFFHKGSAGLLRKNEKEKTFSI